MRFFARTTIIIPSTVLLLNSFGFTYVSRVEAKRNQPSTACVNELNGVFKSTTISPLQPNIDLPTFTLISQPLTESDEETSIKAEIIPEVASISLTQPIDVSSETSAVPSLTPPVQPVPQATGGVLNADILFALVNQTRISAGLPAFEKQGDICAVAASRAPELDNEIFGSSYMHAGFQARTLPYRATENMISQRTEQEALTWWMNSPVHRSAILGDYKYACAACAGRSCTMIFSNLAPK